MTCELTNRIRKTHYRYPTHRSGWTFIKPLVICNVSSSNQFIVLLIIGVFCWNQLCQFRYNMVLTYFLFSSTTFFLRLDDFQRNSYLAVNHPWTHFSNMNKNEHHQLFNDKWSYRQKREYFRKWLPLYSSSTSTLERYKVTSWNITTELILLPVLLS